MLRAGVGRTLYQAGKHVRLDQNIELAIGDEMLTSGKCEVDIQSSLRAGLNAPRWNQSSLDLRTQTATANKRIKTKLQCR